MIIKLIFALTISGWIYWLVAYGFTRSFFHHPQPVHPGFTPPVSILKPVKGLDPEAYENFASFCRQDYPTFEILFGVPDPSDPAVGVITRLKRDFPQCKIILVVENVNQPNRKAGMLHVLSGYARYDVLVASDSDMRVTPDYLQRVVSPLEDPDTGLVTCPYRGKKPVTFTARLEALYMGVSFLPHVMMGRQVLEMGFAMGSTVALTKRSLEKIGGFAAITDYLADDYEIGARIRKTGLRVHLSDYIVTSILGPTSFREQWNREVRWAHCNRVSRPLEYPGLIFTFSTPLAGLLLLATGFASWAWLVFLFSLLLRWVEGWAVTRLTCDETSRRWLIWLPVRDMLSALVWCSGLFGRKVVWRGEQFRLTDDGRLEFMEAVPSGRKWTW